MSLVARHLEANGITTVIIGSAIDIVEHCGVPRYLHSDFPLGNPCGKPYDRPMQESIVSQALGLAESAKAANTTLRTAFTWSKNKDQDEEWKHAYSRVDDTNRERLRLLGEQRRQQQQQSKTSGKARAPMISQN